MVLSSDQVGLVKKYSIGSVRRQTHTTTFSYPSCAAVITTGTMLCMLKDYLLLNVTLNTVLSPIIIRAFDDKTTETHDCSDKERPPTFVQDRLEGE